MNSSTVVDDSSNDVIMGVTFHSFQGPSDDNFFSCILNSNTTYLDVSFDFVETKNVSLYYYDLHNVIPNKSVAYSITCLTDDKSEPAHIEGIIEGEEYDAWGNNDSYITDLIRSNVMALRNRSELSS